MKARVKTQYIDLRMPCFLLALGALLILVASSAYSMPPHPEVQKKIDSGEVAEPFVSSALKVAPMGPELNAASKLKTSQITGPFRALCILVDFSDHASQTNAEFFDTLVYANQPNTVRDYYDEISYSQIDIVTVSLPSDLGWQEAPNTYSYYVYNGYGTDAPYPHNCQKLCEDLVDMVDPVVDFDDYDNDGDGYVDVVMIVHSGPGAEFTGSSNDIWSHKWGISPRHVDGSYVSAYTIMPEFWSSSGDMTIGVFCHELGHAFGLPDLYDTDYSSNGVGRYSLMAGGSWNGSLGSSPAHPDAWCRTQLGWVTPTNITGNQAGVSIPNVENNQAIYRLWTNGLVGNEYFLVENRQKTGYDSYIPGAGLCIWHVDQSVGTNDNEWYPGHTSSGHYKVAMEQADNLYELEKGTDNGDGGDVFPGTTNNTSFSVSTTPGSASYSGGNTLVSVSNISSSALTMTADFAVALAAAADDDGNTLPFSREIVLEQNFPNPFNPNTTIRFTLSVGSEAEINVFNILGEPVNRIESGYHPAGTYEIVWDGRTYDGTPSPSGIYFYELVTDDSKEVRKMLLMK